MVDVAKALRVPLQIGVSATFLCMLAFTLFEHLTRGVPTTSAIMTGLQWSLATAIVTSQKDVGTTGKKALMRVTGTLLGGMWGCFGAEMARSMPDVAAMWVLLVSSLGVVLFKLGGQLVSYEYAGQVGAIATVLISWKSYTDPHVSVGMLFATRVGGICFGTLVANTVALVVLPSTASQKLTERVDVVVKLLQDQCELVWVALCHDGIDAEEELYDRFYAAREKAADELKALRELLGSAAHERYMGQCGGECWVPQACACRRGKRLNEKAGKELITQLRHCNRLVATLFGVAYGDGTPQHDAVQALHRQCRVEEDGGISALWKLRRDTLDAWSRVQSSLAKKLVVRESGTALAVVDIMLRQSSGCPAGLDDEHFQYRWYTFLTLYRTLAVLLGQVQKASAAWVQSLPTAKEGVGVDGALQQPLLKTEKLVA